MVTLYTYLLKMLICSAVLLGYYWLDLRNERFHLWNRFYLLSAVFVSLVVPLIRLPIVVENDPTAMETMIGALPWNRISTPPQPWWTGENLLILAAAIISLVLLVRLVASTRKIFMLYKKHEHAFINEVSVVITKEAAAPFSFFKWLFWRSDIDPDGQNGKRMLAHELVHIKERHSADKLFTELVLVILWINPFFWIIRRELYAIHEFLADRKAIEGPDGAAFAAMILHAAHTGPAPTLSNPFFNSQLKRRLIMITTSHAPKYSYIRRISGLALMLCVTAVLVLSVESSAQKAPPPPPAVPKAPPPPPKADPLPDSIISASVTENNGNTTVNYKMRDGRSITMKIADAKKQGYPLPAPPPPVPAPPPKPEIRAATPKEEAGKVAPDGNVLNTLKLSAGKEPPLVIYAGLKITPAQMQEIDPVKIKSINVLKGASATAMYGEEGKNGVILITPKIGEELKPAEVTGGDARKELVVIGYGASGTTPLYFIDSKQASEATMKQMDPQTIEKINVLKGEAAIKAYGEKGSNGVIEIITKKPGPL